jgi:methionyl-tRNA formyltransferase
MQEVSNLRIGWVGSHFEGHRALEALLEKAVRVEVVITLDEEEMAKRSGARPYDEICQRHGVPLHKVRHINDAESVALLNKLSLDVVFVIGWSQIVGPAALGTARIGMIGAHAALLPHNRGSAPVNWAIIRNETRGGNTLLWLSEGVDEGDIIDQMEFPITAYDTCATVYEKVADTNCTMILRAVESLAAGRRPARPQPVSDEPLLPRRRPEHGCIDWGRDSLEVYNFVRAQTRPYPGAFSRLGGQRYTVWNAAHLPGDPYPNALPGQVLGPVFSPYPSHACGQVVACGKGAVVVLELESADGTVIQGPRLVELMSDKEHFDNE